MGAICATAEEELKNTNRDLLTDAETPIIGMDAEPLWLQICNAHNERKKALQEAWPDLEPELSARAVVKADVRAKEHIETLAKEEAMKKETDKKSTATPQGSPGARTPRPKIVKLTKDQAKQALRRAVAIFEKPENKKKLQEAVASCGDDSAQKLATLLPVVKAMLADLLESYEFPRDMNLRLVPKQLCQLTLRMGAQLARLQAAMEGQVQTSVHMEVGQNGDRTDSSERGVNLPWFVE
ncbi:Hypothetical protein SCF082_LOCUS25283 [Durusdinium trenchii]|uniref:Protein C10 n=1 Tax=Durusdinium trenchii TaxID=1381693 RepID=A0ABP0M2N9_9DINO